MYIICCVGYSTHKLVFSSGKAVKVLEISNDIRGLETILYLDPSLVTFIGNRRWAEPMATNLKDEVPVNYQRRARETRGSRENLVALAKKLLEKGIVGQPFPFQLDLIRFRSKEEAARHLWPLKAADYLKQTQRVRESKGVIRSLLAGLFAEAGRPSPAELTKDNLGRHVKPVPIPVPPGLWTKSMRVVLDHPDPVFLERSDQAPESIRILAERSLSRKMPKQLRKYYEDQMRREVLALRYHESEQADALKKILEAVGDNRVFEFFEKKTLSLLICALLGWREWPKWKELRSYAGLALTAVDDRGNLHIGGRHPEVRQTLFLMATTTGLGKAISALERTIDPESGERRPRHIRVKRIERLLRWLHRFWLQPNPEDPKQTCPRYRAWAGIVGPDGEGIENP